ncbi:hypothetical protein H2O64_13325 [Kordia sp. YSTF-M3]|uniref:Bacteriocin n=1 Tax=Kordia aestuariivivens TaxID=2759037 RepID=A0ABR7QAX8_9FLAO|nr:hypothetical protein [Kordia aestuariivivens]MBC8755653.1 hypothetical protein [Kordia aestuariivivens]
MKKRNVKTLRLNKSNVSKFNNILGGRAPGGGGSDPVGITDDCPPSLPHTDCYCGSDFKNGCGSIIGHC